MAMEPVAGNVCCSSVCNNKDLFTFSCHELQSGVVAEKGISDALEKLGGGDMIIVLSTQRLVGLGGRGIFESLVFRRVMTIGRAIIADSATYIASA